MSAPKSAPDLKIPNSNHTVSVSIIDTTTFVNGLPTAAFTLPEVAGYSVINGGRAWSFLIKHDSTSGDNKYCKVLFDLGARVDVENGPTAFLEQMKAAGVQMGAEKSVSDILKGHGEDPSEIGGIIWSHYHPDHTGDPALFPTSTDLIVGPGFKQAFVPAWPTKADSPVDEKAWAGRELVEIDFDAGKSLMLGQYKAFDFYGDGSFYLVNSPGHAVGHMSALARTSANEFVLLGGDVCHHGSEFRPTEYIPLPESIEPNPLIPPFAKSTFVCPGSIFEAIHPERTGSKPFVKALGFMHDDSDGACDSVEKLLKFDAQENIFVLIAHDMSLANVLDFYPKTINDWKKQGWDKQTHWRFLRDFDTGKEEYVPT